MKDFASYSGGDGIEEIVQRFSGKRDGDLLKEIYLRAAEGKRAGTLSNEQIDAFCTRLSPLLDGAKRKRLYELCEQLKRIRP